MTTELTRLTEGMVIPWGGNRYTTVTAELAATFVAGDRLVVVQDTGALLHIPAEDWTVATDAVERAWRAFGRMGEVSDTQISQFYDEFADRLEDDDTFDVIRAANTDDVDRAQQRGRTTTRLVLTPTMRADMVAGLRTWGRRAGGRGDVIETVDHTGWSVDLVRAGLGVVGFVFEGRPNVFADATGVLRAGNTVVFRIGSDALGTARAIVTQALDPALEQAGLPNGAATLVDTPSRAAGWAMFSNPQLSLAVARGSGPAVSQLGAVARQAGTSVSLHGTGGAWIVAADDADIDAFAAAVYHSLDRKVCNTLNTCTITANAADRLIPAFLDAFRRAADRRGTEPKLHVTSSARPHVPEWWFESASITRAGGPVTEPRTELISETDLGIEWEWEDSPEVTLHVTDGVDEAVDLFNSQSPRFVASLISSDSGLHDRFWNRIDSPFVGNGFTRWVDGQYALDRPELGLSNWQFGRLFGRGGVLSGDSVFTVRTRATQTDAEVGR